MLNYLLASRLICSAEKFTHGSFLVLMKKRVQFQFLAHTCCHDAAFMRLFFHKYSRDLQKEFYWPRELYELVQNSRVMLPWRFQWLPINAAFMPYMVTYKYFFR